MDVKTSEKHHTFGALRCISVFELETYSIPVKDWANCDAPKEAKELLKDGGGPIGLANHLIYGWFVLGAGQGPCVLWSANNYKWDYYNSCIEVPEKGMSKPKI